MANERGVTKKFRAIVAAARRVDVSSTASIKATVTKRRQWQEEIWDYYDEVPEVKFALNFLANGMQKVRFFAGARNEDGTIVPINDEGSPLKDTPIAKQAEAEMARLRNGVSGQGELNRLLTLNLEAPGECSLHGLAAIDPVGIPGTPEFTAGRLESWDVRSVSEVDVTEQTTLDPVTGVQRPKIIIRRSPDDKGVEFDPNTETLIRFWQRHPRYTEWADSLLRSCMSDCEMLTLLQGEAKAISKSRHNAGAFTLPSELSFVDDSKTGDEPQENDGDDDEGSNAFISAFMAHMVDPITDPSSSASVQRLVISGPAEYLKPDVLRTIDLSRPADDKLTEKLDRHINRLARGLNVPVEVVMGHMSTTFSNAEQIDQDTFDDHFDPRCISIADGYATGFLRPQLEAAGTYDVEQVGLVEVGYDPSALVRDESLDQKADSMLEHGAINYAAYRRIRGVGEEDAPDDKERMRNLVERKGILTADLVKAMFEYAGIVLNVEAIPTASPAPPQDQQPADQQPVAASALVAASKLSTVGARLAAIDRRMRERLAGAVDMAMMRALERAGNKLKTTRPVQASAQRIPARRVAATLGPQLIADAGLTASDLLDGAWDDLGVQFKTWAEGAGDAALAVVKQTLSTDLSEAEIYARKVRQIASIDDAWTWLSSSLSDIGKEALFNDAVPGIIGEVDELSHVPPGILREALMRAGGATGFHSKDGVITPANKVPLGGIATGQDTMELLSEHGVGVEGYIWVYGAARRRPFEPHQQLDGAEFVNFDSPILTNGEGWPETAFYYPGDHNGCVCDFEPALVTAVHTDRTLKSLSAGTPEGDFLADDAAEEVLSEQFGNIEFNHDDLRASAEYTQFSFDLNNALRSGNVRQGPDYWRLRNGLEHLMTPIASPVEMYRAVPASVLEDLKVGDVLVDKAFQSTTTSFDAVEEYVSQVATDIGVEPAMLTIRAPAGTRGFWQGSLEAIDEAPIPELTLARGTSLRVVSVGQQEVAGRIVRHIIAEVAP